MGACAAPAGGGTSTQPTNSVNTADTNNPFGMAASGTGEVVIPDQGWGTAWIEQQIAAFNKLHPDMKVTMTAHKDMNVTIQPRFIQGSPPDLIMPAGIQVKTLVEQNQVFDLTEFFNAPAFDGGGTIGESLLPGTLEAADFVNDGRKLVAPYTFTAYGLWYSSRIFKEKGWEYPKTWDAMIELCTKIKADGQMAPWTYTGKYPGYVLTPMVTMAAKTSGIDWIYAVDNLEPNAWKDPGFVAAAEAIAELRAKGFFLPGSEGLSHTESQTLWAQGKAAFIPVGGWLENESEASINKADLIRMEPTPSLTAGDKLPFATLAAYPGNQTFVPVRAKNKAFAQEFLRFQWSKEGSAIWTKNTKSFTSLKGYYDKLTDVPSGLASQIEAIKAAGENILPPMKYSSYYPDLSKAIVDKTGLLAAGKLTAQQYVDQVQAEADKVAADPNIKKIKRARQ